MMMMMMMMMMMTIMMMMMIIIIIINVMNPRANHYPKNDRVPLAWVGGSLAPLQQS